MAFQLLGQHTVGRAGEPAMTGSDAGGDERDRETTEIDARFAAIVADWGSDEPRWPADSGEGPADDAEPGPEPQVPVAAEEPAVAAAGLEEEDEGHYIPPDPPPLPRPRAVTTGALVLLGIGVILLFVPGLVGLTDVVGLPLGLLAVASGLFWLFLLLRTGPPIDSGWDDGSKI